METWSRKWMRRIVGGIFDFGGSGKTEEQIWG